MGSTGRSRLPAWSASSGPTTARRTRSSTERSSSSGASATTRGSGSCPSSSGTPPERPRVYDGATDGYEALVIDVAGGVPGVNAPDPGSYREFWAYYLSQHLHPMTRRVHAAAT